MSGTGPAVDVHVAAEDEVAAAGALTAEAYHADGLLDAHDDYLAELRDAERRAREAVLLVATVRTVDPAAARGTLEDGDAAGGAEGAAERGRAATGGAPTAPVVVGSITLAPYGTSYAEVAEPGEVELRMLAVAPEARRRGVAERLVTAALREAVARGARRVVLSTLDAMTVAQRLYRRLGFDAEPERDWSHEGVTVRVLAWRAPTPPRALVELAAWPPVTTELVDGWRVGLSGGFTRRANSAVPLSASPDAAATLGRVESRYAEAGLPAVVRVCSAAPPGLDAMLAGRGYRAAAATDVLVRSSPSEGAPVPGSAAHVGLRVADEPDDAWLQGWLAVKAGTHAVDADVARAVVTGSRALYLTASDPHDGTVLGVVRAASVDDWVGLSCLVVAPHARRRGIGRLLTDAALRSAAERGARRAFLQVEVANRGAADLYATAGFLPAERYHYRER